MTMGTNKKYMDCFKPNLSETDTNKLSMLALAHVGDAVYELLIRTMLCTRANSSVAQLHKQTVSYVNAPAQAMAAERIIPLLRADEAAVYRRGRNAKVNSVPHNANIGQYHAATGLEALFGWLYLQGRTARIEELFAAITEEE